MRRIINWFRQRFGRQAVQRSEADAEALRVAFRDRYHNFRLLLSANNRSLEMMAEIEQALQGNRPFGMTFVRSNATGVSVNVLRMIRNLEMLAPGKYDGLRDSFNRIRENVEGILRERRHAHPPAGENRLVVPLGEVGRSLSDTVGSKMAHLGEIRRQAAEQEFMVPSGFAVTAHAYDRFMEESGLRTEINRLFQTADTENIEQLYTLSADIQQRIIRAELPPDIAEAIDSACETLRTEMSGVTTVALRSSALGEDAAGSSFAGQYRSVLNVSFDNVLDTYKEVVAGKYSLQAITYRLNRGFRDEDIAMAVGCIGMVDAVAGGVTYSRNPVDVTDDAIYINAAWGLPKSVVDGTAACDLFVMSRTSPGTLLREEVRSKDKKFVCYPDDGVCRLDLTGPERDKSCLNREQQQALAEIALRLEEYYGSPQDIEWAIGHDGHIYLFQCRPLQQKAVAKRAASSSETGTPDRDDAEETDTLLLRGGITASPGAACGKVFVATQGADTLRFPGGGVLVVRQALPSWASLLNRAAAVVTEQGGVAGHLASVAREFGIPALFGLSDAVNELTTGDTITVDADGLSVYSGCHEALLRTVGEKPNLMAGSPVYDTLQRVSEWIIPLHLLDPESRDFRPENCRTYHDITRFIHEQSVHDMFSFGQDHDFPERSSKQLHYRVPMQWWVLNLDDGFKEELTGKYVRLEDIASVPMIAFWDGFVAIPWEGPPPMDGAGLMSVMFHSTANTALTPGVKSSYAQRNYFMISRHYCNLSSRLGYHFSTLEALVSERCSENYISFQFKGGAADHGRRLKRVAFIRDILENREFRVRVRDDHLTARIEGYDEGYMKDRLRILGYLSLHTRQLDMIMTNPSRVAYYREKIEKDISSLLTGETVECVQ